MTIPHQGPCRLLAAIACGPSPEGRGDVEVAGDAGAVCNTSLERTYFTEYAAHAQMRVACVEIRLSPESKDDKAAIPRRLTPPPLP